MSDVVQQAKAALEGVTEGPWAVDVDGSTHLAYDRPIYDAKKSPIAVCPDCGVRGGFEVATAEFIAAARSLVPDLVAEVKELRGAIETIRGIAHGGEKWPSTRHMLDILAVIERTEQP